MCQHCRRFLIGAYFSPLITAPDAKHSPTGRAVTVAIIDSFHDVDLETAREFTDLKEHMRAALMGNEFLGRTTAFTMFAVANGNMH